MCLTAWADRGRVTKMYEMLIKVLTEKAAEVAIYLIWQSPVLDRDKDSWSF